MAKINYIVNQDSPETIAGVEKYSEADKALVSNFQVNNLFDSTKNIVELHILSLADDLIESDYAYKSYKELGNAQSAGREGASVLTIDPIEDSKRYGYETGGIKLLYHFLNDLYSKNSTPIDFFIDSISEDRTELILKSLQLTKEDLTTYTENLKNRLQTELYFSEFRLNFKNNDLFIGINVDTLIIRGESVVTIKLYEPLPQIYLEKSILNVVEFIADSIAYEVDSTISIETITIPTLKPANFDIEVEEPSVVPSQYYDYDELFSYPVNNTNNQVYSLAAEKGAQISIDHTDYANFVHFSSAQERLANFKYKLDLISSYTTSRDAAASATTGLQGISGSISYFENLITGIVSNFDHYERYLYYETGDFAWPKSNTTKPYINLPSSDSAAILWYSNQTDNAVGYDNGNYSSLENGIPAYLRDDDDNANLIVFIHMLGQHFDNLWIYSKAVTDKYDADNRLNNGVSRDLIADTLKNFGVKIYTSNKSLQDLFTSFTQQNYNIGNEQIAQYIDVTTSTNSEGTSYGDYQKEIYKRIYHNLPLLIKSKGTERGIKALINCFGIPSDILTVKLYGGIQRTTGSFFGDQQYYTSSLGKIRLNNTGSIVEGDSLSELTSTIKKVNQYTDDLHRIEIGFSPVDNINNYIISYSLADPTLSNFNIDNYIGDPRELNSGSYASLVPITQQISNSLTKYNLQDYVRLIKFFDNVIFKMVKDFVPARSVTDTGVIIKPHLLTRSKSKSVKATVDTINTSSIDTAFIYPTDINTAFISGSNAKAFGSRDQYITTTGSYIVRTPIGSLQKPNSTEDKKFNGEFTGSGITVTTGELNIDNPYKSQVLPPVYYNTYFYTEPVDLANLCTIVPKGITYTITSGETSDLNNYFTDGGFPVPANTVFRSGSTTITSPYTFTQPQYTAFSIAASASGTTATDCTASILFEIFTCSLAKNGSIPSAVQQDTSTISSQYNLLTWFITGSNSRLLFEVSQSSTGITSFTTASISASAYEFKNTGNYTIKLYDTYRTSCIITQTVTSNAPGIVEKYIQILEEYPVGTSYIDLSVRLVDAYGTAVNASENLSVTIEYRYTYDNGATLETSSVNSRTFTILSGTSISQLPKLEADLGAGGSLDYANLINVTPTDAYTTWLQY